MRVRNETIEISQIADEITLFLDSGIENEYMEMLEGRVTWFSDRFPPIDGEHGRL